LNCWLLTCIFSQRYFFIFIFFLKENVIVILFFVKEHVIIICFLWCIIF
jgi:hypothetical protein